MSASSDSHGWVLEAVDLYELQLQRYARRLVGDFDLAADGDLNVGVTSAKALTDLITEKAKGESS